MNLQNVLIALTVLLLVLGCSPEQPKVMDSESRAQVKAIPQEPTLSNAQDSAEESTPPQNDASSMDSSTYQGTLLAGTTSPYLEFSEADYDKALSEGKTVLLYFYASWCPICRAEQPAVHSAFAGFSDPALIGFRVNYKDGDTDEAEVELAKQFGITYQHTKVILKNGERVVKSPESWSQERYETELAQLS